MKKGAKKFLVFISCLLLVYLAAGIGSYFTATETKSAWYESIRPSLTPPNWVFPIVWNILFFLIVCSLYFSLMSAKKKNIKLKIYTLFGFNFILNILWSFFYFYLRNVLVAYFDLILLLGSIAMLISFTWKVNRKSAWLLVPYLIWVSFAGILNFLSLF